MGNIVKLQIRALRSLMFWTWPTVVSSPLKTAITAQQADIHSNINEADGELVAAAAIITVAARRRARSDVARNRWR